MADQRTPDFVQTLQQLLWDWLGRVNTHLPGVVQSYDATTRTATVQIATKRKLLNAALEVIPPIQNVRVAFTESGDWEILHDLAQGDEGQLHFAGRSLEKWRVNGGTVDPGDPRRHDLQDCWFVPGGQSKPRTSAGVSGKLVIRRTDGSAAIELDKATSAVILTGVSIKAGSSAASSKAATAPLVDAQLAALEAVFTAWVPAPGDGGAVLKTALTTLISGGWPASTACTKVDVE